MLTYYFLPTVIQDRRLSLVQSPVKLCKLHMMSGAGGGPYGHYGSGAGGGVGEGGTTGVGGAMARELSGVTYLCGGKWDALIVLVM